MPAVQCDELAVKALPPFILLSLDTHHNNHVSLNDFKDVEEFFGVEIFYFFSTSPMSLSVMKKCLAWALWV